MDKFEAIGYLIENSVYDNEWRGAGMYQAIEDVYKSTKANWSVEELKLKLKEAFEF